jgi:hypothetical protein
MKSLGGHFIRFQVGLRQGRERTKWGSVEAFESFAVGKLVKEFIGDCTPFCLFGLVTTV